MGIKSSFLALGIAFGLFMTFFTPVSIAGTNRASPSGYS